MGEIGSVGRMYAEKSQLSTQQYARSVHVVRRSAWPWTLWLTFGLGLAGYFLGSLLMGFTHGDKSLLAVTNMAAFERWATVVRGFCTVMFSTTGFVIGNSMRLTLRAVVTDTQMEWHRRYVAEYDSTGGDGRLHDSLQLGALLDEGRRIGTV